MSSDPESELWSAICTNNKNVVLELIRQDQTLLGYKNGKQSLLTWAVELGHTDIVDMVLGSDYRKIVINYGDPSSICLAAMTGNLELVKKLEVAGADIEERESCYTPLMYASEYNKVEVIKFLLSKGADINVIRWLGSSALSIAWDNNSTGAIAELLSCVELYDPLKTVKGRKEKDLLLESHQETINIRRQLVRMMELRGFFLDYYMVPHEQAREALQDRSKSLIHSVDQLAEVATLDSETAQERLEAQIASITLANIILDRTPEAGHMYLPVRLIG